MGSWLIFEAGAIYLTGASDLWSPIFDQAKKHLANLDHASPEVYSFLVTFAQEVHSEIPRSFIPSCADTSMSALTLEDPSAGESLI